MGHAAQEYCTLSNRMHTCEACNTASEFWDLLSDQSLQEAGFDTTLAVDKTRCRLVRTRFTLILKASDDSSDKVGQLLQLVDSAPSDLPDTACKELRCIRQVLKAEEQSPDQLETALEGLSSGTGDLQFADVFSSWPSGQALVEDAEKVLEMKAINLYSSCEQADQT